MTHNEAGFSTGTADPIAADWQDLEREARRLRAEYARDHLIRLTVFLDLQVRRLAHRLFARVRWLGGTHATSSH